MSLYLKLDQNQFDVYIEKIYSNVSQAQISSVTHRYDYYSYFIFSCCIKPEKYLKYTFLKCK